jgi:hypothetical protein
MPMLKRSKHNLSHYRLLTCNMGELIPVGCVEVLPGDTFQHQASALVRVSPLVAPVMHPVSVRLHSFFVPNRITWTSWEDFITGGADGNNSDTVPTVSHTGSPSNEPLLDYLGVPPVASLSGINALPVRAYNKIYDEFYRDQDLVTELGTTNQDDMNIHNIAWEKDYFTEARPWEQKGTAVSVPIGTSAPVLGIGLNNAAYGASGSVTVRESDDGTTTANGWIETNSASAGSAQYAMLEGTSGYPNIYADLSAATGVDINDLREAFALQRFKEARALYGSRYTEYLAYLGIDNGDARLQRPEYLGGGRQTISFSEVLQTAPESASSSVVGELAGHGIAALRTHRYRRFFKEHGFVITLLSVRPKVMYEDALHRKFIRTDKEDFYQKELELIGQQEVYNKEIYAPNTSTGDNVWGYTDRYREYREEPSLVHGEFRTTLDHFHMARDHSSQPTLNQSFIECDATKRIHANTTDDALWVMVNHNLRARRMVRKSPKARII